MKIINRKEFLFKEVDIGDAFLYKGDLYIKASLHYPVNLGTGESTRIDLEEPVCVVNAEVVI